MMMPTVESILVNNGVYSLELELELLRFFENIRLDFNASRSEHVIKRSKRLLEGNHQEGVLMPTVESILVNNGVDSKPLKHELLRFFESKRSVYNTLGFDQAIYKSIIARLEYKKTQGYCKAYADNPESKAAFIGPLSKAIFIEPLKESA
ncbi:MAG: hypothetical protein V7731_15455 [Amphritea sp.]